MKLMFNKNLTFSVILLFVLAGPSHLMGQANNVFSPGTSAITFGEIQVETGPILDVVPYVLSDGYTINMNLIPSLTDFNGYDTPPNIPNVTGALNVVELPIVLPDFTIRQVVTSVNVWDNQTVVIGGLISSSVNSTKDKVPVIGDSDDELPFAQSTTPVQPPGADHMTETVKKVHMPDEP
jgi:Flp pilus assembly secretin CpaC